MTRTLILYSGVTGCNEKIADHAFTLAHFLEEEDCQTVIQAAGDLIPQKIIHYDQLIILYDVTAYTIPAELLTTLKKLTRVEGKTCQVYSAGLTDLYEANIAQMSSRVIAHWCAHNALKYQGTLMIGASSLLDETLYRLRFMAYLKLFAKKIAVAESCELELTYPSLKRFMGRANKH